MENNKTPNWIKRNWEILTILLVALVIRIYYFVMTQASPLWYDESVYMLMSQRFAFGTTYIFGPVRQVLFPFIISLFYRISTTEFLPRLFILVLSMFSIYGMYLLGKELFNKRVGLISSFLMSVFYLNLFFTFRLLVDLPSLTFFIFSAYFFIKYFRTKKNSNLYLFALLIGIGTLFKLSTAFLLITCFIYLLFTRELSLIKRKEFWISVLIFCLVLSPYIIWGFFEFGGFVLTQASAHVSPDNYLNGFNLILGYIKLLPTYFSIIFLVLFGLGLIYSIYKPILYFNKLKENENLKKCFYLLLIFIVPLVLISFLVNHIENRYIITCFASMIILGSFVIDNIYLLIKKHSKVIGVILVILLLGFFTFHQISMADDLIKNKLDSYREVKDAGIWLKEYSNSYGKGLVATKSQPQIKYYSGLDTINLPPTEEEFINWTTELNPQYLMLSIFEVHPEWSYSYPERNNLTIIQAYITQENQPLIIIYKLK